MHHHLQPIWRFADSVDSNRAEKLLLFQSYQEILELLLESLEIEAFECEPARAARLKGCRRASFLLDVPVEVYDTFFNSPEGYRSRYAIGPEEGIAANRSTIESLLPSLSQFSETPDLSVDGILTSLHGRGAKIWIYENEVADQMGKPDPDILYPPWEEASADAAGLLAPLGTKLEVKGGWISEAGKEVLDPHKAGRSSEIHNVGYT